jgi:proteasome assembly chaperone (PAC2) family protein
MELNEDFPFEIYGKPELQSSIMVVGWGDDAGKVGQETTGYLNKELGGIEFGEIKTTEFFPTAGISMDNDIARFSETKFYCCQQKNLVIFRSIPPRFGWYKFIDALLDVAEQCCYVKELYTVGGMVTSCAHTAPRKLFAAANSPELKEILSRYELTGDVVSKTSTSQRPTLNSFLLWLAKRRNIIGANLLVPVPFYLASTEDPQAWRKPVEFLDRRFSLGIDFRDLDEEITRQNESISQLRNRFSEIDSCIEKLESNMDPTSEENEKLVREIKQCSKKPD